MSGKLNKARAREQSANKRENEWKKQFIIMRDKRDSLKIELEKANEVIKELNKRIEND